MIVEERLEVTHDGRQLASPVAEIAADHAGRIHLVRALPGSLSFAASRHDSIDFHLLVPLRARARPLEAGSKTLPDDRLPSSASR